MIFKMVGIDFQLSNLDVREKLALSKAEQKDLLENMKTEQNIKGCIILSTCNRTELYLSLHKEMNILSLFCAHLGLDKKEYSQHLILKKNKEAVNHLMLLAPGLLSQMRGDDQILSQIKDALATAREQDTTDSILEVVFQTAISCGKQIKTDVEIASVNTSVASAAVDFARNYFHGLADKRVLLIGNGRMGRLAAELLIQEQANVTVTLRSYKSGNIIVPKGAKTVCYADRYNYVGNCDLLLSATASPHYTITKKALEGLEDLPKLALDLAVPRDIEPSNTQLGVKLFDIDCFNHVNSQLDFDTKLQVDHIIKKCTDRFYHWLAYTENLSSVKENEIENICYWHRSGIDRRINPKSKTGN